ncbi:hypothetical protein L195_g041873 [Trifolium pratense]|uniref:Uncharacterized protein n=2 Tax=Trifolium pratense TaxID=57577 RepID=A0A2K3M4U6_TRIPR|nr:uncharacterized protein LOC123904665 [Trifolium pratense]PNX85799.1 hypothetical protein L195_g041873 [Trifolium pratense]CAJ2649960.1 unnamed protein product [Trifolium pratense]
MDPSASSSSSNSSTIVTLSHEDFLLFHQMDRDLYSILVNNLSRDPLESMQLLSLWLWLERVGFRSVVKNIMALPVILINEIADESTICLSYLVNTNNNTCLIPSLSPASESNEIPLLQSIVKEEITLKLFLENRATVIQGIESTKQDICLKALSDIMQEAMMRDMAERMVEHNNLLFGSLGPANLQFGSVGGSGIAGAIIPQQIYNNGGGFVAPDDRTLFVTFSKGYRVEEWEVRNFLTMTFGDCIENFKFQETANNEQPLFARIVFHNVSTIQMILGGASKVKFTINGKHVWARKFVPKRGRMMQLQDTFGFGNAGFGM